MPYADLDRRLARQAWNRRRALFLDGLAPLDGTDPASDLRCRACGKVTPRTSAEPRHERYCRPLARIPLDALLAEVARRLGI